MTLERTLERKHLRGRIKPVVLVLKNGEQKASDQTSGLGRTLLGTVFDPAMTLVGVSTVNERQYRRELERQVKEMNGLVLEELVLIMVTTAYRWVGCWRRKRFDSWMHASVRLSTVTVLFDFARKCAKVKASPKNRNLIIDHADVKIEQDTVHLLESISDALENSHIFKLVRPRLLVRRELQSTWPSVGDALESKALQNWTTCRQSIHDQVMRSHRNRITRPSCDDGTIEPRAAIGWKSSAAKQATELTPRMCIKATDTYGFQSTVCDVSAMLLRSGRDPRRQLI